jgi:hypothetical protein
MLTRQAMLRLQVLASACALTHPYCAGTKHAPQLASAWQVGPVARAEGEILMVAGHGTSWVSREPVIWIRPFGSQAGIEAGLADTFGQLG